MHKFLSKYLIVSLLMICILSSCQSQNQKSLSLEVDDFNGLIANYEKEFPGRGKDILSDNDSDRPMAYGLILSALAQQYKSTGEKSNYDLMQNAGWWLLQNSDVNKDNIIGYGLPDAWDAFSDDSVNPENQEYTITSAFVIGGLLDWLEADPKAPKDEIHKTILAVLEPYLSEKYTTASGLYSYSLNQNDILYDDFNPSAYLAGQMQRYSQLLDDDVLKRNLQYEADRIMQVIIQYHKEENNYWYWHNGLQEKLQRPSDLVHAIYIIEGIRQYRLYDGQHADEFDWTKIIEHLSAFLYQQSICEWVNMPDCHKRPVRLWALGMLLYLVSVEEVPSISTEKLINVIMAYQMPNGHFRFVTGADDVYIRHEAHLLFGMSYYLFSDN